MNEKDCWNKFANSGRIEDYLEYCSNAAKAAHNGDTHVSVSAESDNAIEAEDVNNVNAVCTS